MSQQPEEYTVAEPTLAEETDVLEESHVYVHCYFNNTSTNLLIRIWKSTYLTDKNSSHRSKLVHIENISYAPVWTPVPPNSPFQFLLIFEALPKGCEIFDLVEDIPQPGGFYVSSIMRNKIDVYHVHI
jgi:hypothetical protein